MMKTLLWIVVIGLLVILAKRLFSGLVGVIVFAVAIFFSIFMLDTFTIVNVRDHINVDFYDETRKNPKETADKVIASTKEAGQVAVNKINEVGEKANDRYNTQSIVDMDAVGGATEGEAVKTVEVPAKEEIVAETPVSESKKKDSKIKLPKAITNGDDVPTVEGFTYYPIKEQAKVVQAYKDKMSERDLALLKALTPFITVSYEGDAFNFHTERGVKGFYIQTN